MPLLTITLAREIYGGCTPYRLRNRPNAATPWDAAEGEEGEHPGAATRRRGSLGEGRQHIHGHCPSTVHVEKMGYLLRESSVKCRKVV
jgi:hypothetical protein